jgi:hypothetical protein
MPFLDNPLERLPEDALKVALEASETLMQHKRFLPSGLLVMLVSCFRDNVRDALDMEPERFATTTRTGRGKIRSLDDLTSTELDKISGAAAILLQERFTDLMDDKELAVKLFEFHLNLTRQKTEREQLKAS